MMTYLRRNILSREEAKPIIAGYIDRLRAWLHEAFDWLQAKLNNDPDLRLRCDLSIQAALVYNRFVESMQAGLFDDPNVDISRRGRMVMVVIDRIIRLRFKKFNTNLRSGNVHTTKQAEHYYQLQLPGVEDRMTDVTFGYCTNRFATTLTGVYITCPRDWKRNKWFIPIEDAASGTLNLFSQPSGPMPDSEQLPDYTPKIAPPTTGEDDKPQ